MTARYTESFRTMLNRDLAAYIEAYAAQEGITASAVLRKAIAEHRDRRRAAERENHRHAKALHSAIEGDFERTTAGVN